MDDVRINLEESPRPPLALVFTDSRGRVISMHGPLLDRMKIDDPGRIIGEPLHRIFGIEFDSAKPVIERVAQDGDLLDWALDLYPPDSDPIPVLCTSIPTFNDRGDFMGADITLYERPAEATGAATGAAVSAPPAASPTDTLITHIQQVQASLASEEDRVLLRLYAAVQFSALHVLLARLAGLRITQTLETTINKAAAKKGWPLSINGDRLLLEQDDVPPDVYRAVLDETVRFAATIIGRRTVAATMRAVDERMNPRAVDLAEQSGLRRLFQDTGFLRGDK